MGAVLAMKKFTRFAAIGLALLSAAACGPLSKGSPVSRVGSVLMGGITGGADAPTATASITQEQVQSEPGKYIRVYTRNLDRWDTNVQSGDNGNRTTWVDSSGVSITFENGIVVATRGLVRDLMAADVSEVPAAIRSGGGEARRRHEFLTNMDRISTELLQCRIVSQGPETIERLKTKRNTTRFEEKCSGEGLQFTNVYWINGAGAVIRSLQAISPQAGYLQIDIF
jgi:hypothetical protein